MHLYLSADVSGRTHRGLPPLLLALLLGGCVGAVPLPGLKSGRAVDEETAAQIAPGTTIADVVLRLGEPDSVSADGRTIAYRYSRLWGAAWVAVGGEGGGAAAGMPIEYGEALVVTFDEQNRVVRAERQKGGWFKQHAGDAEVLYGAGTPAALDGNPVLAAWPTRWWLTGGDATQPGSVRIGVVAAFMRRSQLLSPGQDMRDAVFVGGTTGTASTTGPAFDGVVGRLFLTATEIHLRPEHASGTERGSMAVVSLAQVRDRIFIDRGTPNERVVLVLADGRLLTLVTPETPPPAADGPALQTVLGPPAPRETGAPPAWPRQGWSVATLRHGRLTWGDLKFGCFWLYDEGLGFEWFEANGPPGARFLPWTEIRDLHIARLWFGQDVELRLVDNTRMRIGALGGVARRPGFRPFPERMVEAWEQARRALPPAGKAGAALP